MAIINPLITAPFDHNTDFTELADNCERFCEAIARLLISNTLAPDTARTMSDLLAELTGYFAERLKAPRWLTTETGVEWIN
ncbi:hypothetical protein [Leclercia sp.]|uniref:hypothetical protein n=1 Tax=Leclercia sp. TaxID=1898428 RepID=UPI0028AC5391|nr:hypothetical protein [Leclercia sp.]